MNRILAILIACIASAAVAPLATAKGMPRPGDGDYSITVAGAGKGTGTATVSGGKVKIDATVTTEKGEKGSLSAADLTIVKNHFSGTGTVMGQSATFKGRLDIPDSVDEKAIKGVRITATVKTADGNYYRLAGYVPALAQAPDSSDDNPGTGTGGTGSTGGTGTGGTGTGGTGTGTGGGKKDDDDGDDDDKRTRSTRNVRPQANRVPPPFAGKR